MRSRSGLSGKILGGWAINGIVQLTSGLPVTVSQSGDSQNNGGGAPRPNVVAGKSVPRVSSDRNLDHWFDTTAFIRSKCDGCPTHLVFGPGSSSDPSCEAYWRLSENCRMCVVVSADCFVAITAD